MRFISNNYDKYLFLIANGNPNSNITKQYTIDAYISQFNAY